MIRLSTVPLAGAFLYALAVPAAQAQSQAPNLPEGAGKQLVEGTCTACHQTNQITRSSGYTREGWKELIGTMIDLSGSPKEQGEITSYLAQHFPPDTKRAPSLLPGDAKIAFEAWKVPTLGQRSRDPIEANDGTIWWAGQWGNLIGRINPATGEMKEYPLPAGSMPHTVTLDRAGKVWFTGNKNATIGKLDPDTGEVTVYEMPNPAAKDPHSAINESGKRPDALVRFDPATETFQSWPIPSGEVYAGIIRHMRPTRDGNLVIHQSSTNHILRVNL